MEKKHFILIGVVFIIIVFYGCSSGETIKTTKEQDCIYLSELDEDELWGLIEKKIENLW